MVRVSKRYSGGLGLLGLCLAGVGCANQFDPSELVFEEREPEPEMSPDVEEGEPDPPLAFVPNAACEVFAACGGDIVGAYDFVEPCNEDFLVEGLDIERFCPEVIQDADALLEGSVEYRRDGTWSDDLALRAERIFVVPPSCLLPGDRCEALGCGAGSAACLDRFGARGAVECLDLDGGCRCVERINQSRSARGTFTVQGARLVQVFEGSGARTEGDFCLEGDELRFDAIPGGEQTLLRRR